MVVENRSAIASSGEGKTPDTLAVGDWVWLSPALADGAGSSRGAPCRILGRFRAWEKAAYDVWIPEREIALRVNGAMLMPLSEASGASVHGIQAIAAASRINDALSRDDLVAPLAGAVEPLPHQVSVLSRAVGSDRMRWLLADEVGLGKTIEAGLIFKELKARGLVKRVLVVAPSGLVRQWAEEMMRHFHEPFRVMLPGEFPAVRHALGMGDSDNLWRVHDQVICPLDAVKPLDARRGWSREQLARHNRERFEDLITADWDLVIVDEAHRLGGSTSQVARYKLGEALSQASPYLLLLSATPHQGKTDAFRRLMAFLDPDVFVGDDLVSRERVAPYVIRTEKRHAIDTNGRPLFQPRNVSLQRVSWGAGDAAQRDLYAGVTEYVREGYARAQRTRQTAVGFLMVLFQRMVTSSTHAIGIALERRLAALAVAAEDACAVPSLFDGAVAEDETFWELDAEAQLDAVVRAQTDGFTQEQRELETLVEAARLCEAAGPDAKARALLDTMVRLERETADPALKVLVFTEFLPTQAMLVEYLAGCGISTVTLNGGMGPDERERALKTFACEARVLISTDAGGEGLNLQFASVVVNYDLPWNPMKIEQRIGRVDRIGQKRPVYAVNLALEESVELRVQEVLEQKLKRILEDLGVDKLADVLDSEAAGAAFETLYAEAATDPAHLEERVAAFAAELRERATAARSGLLVLGDSQMPDAAAARELAEHRLPRWTERLVVSSLWDNAASGARAEPVLGRSGTWRLRWPSGMETARAVFDVALASDPTVEHLSLDDDRVRALAIQLPTWVPGLPLASVVVSGVSEHVSGTWGLWRIGVQGAGPRALKVFPVFVADDGRVLAPTARTVWDRVLAARPEPLAFREAAVTGPEAEVAFARLEAVVEEQGGRVYEALVAEQEMLAHREANKMKRAFAARRTVIERVGLLHVRQYRVRQLEEDERKWEMLARERKARQAPEMRALVLLRVRSSTEMRPSHIASASQMVG
jgi:superfamily II DNA or RNA helicase